MSKPTVFISYSHKDEKYKDLLRPQLGVLQQAGRITIWDDRKIGAGDDWYDKIATAMEGAAVAVCLISADYLSSKFCTEDELPYLLERRERDGMVILPVYLRRCAWKAVEWLKATQMIPTDGKYVAKDFKDNEDEIFAQVAERIFDIIDDPDYEPPARPPPKWKPPDPGKIDIGRLPVTGADLFGRKKELALLDDAWKSEKANVLAFVAWGGVGKSTLINKWLERLEADNYRGARRVYGWSFYSQGTGERVSSADLFIATALEWFGDKNPTEGSPWDKGERLANLIRRKRTLLILDGMEPLQSHLDYERGKINDPALAVLVEELSRDNPGLCLITTREHVPELVEFSEAAQEHSLDQISPEAGRGLLRVGRIHGSDEDLERACEAFGNHALAINLLTSYLHDLPGRRIEAAFDIPDLDIPEDKGRHPRRVIAAFQERFGEGPEVEVLRILGLFDRPAAPGEITALRKFPPIPHLTEHIGEECNDEWRNALDTLRRVGLIAKESDHRPGSLDAHPVVREHLAHSLQSDHADTWRTGHSRLYDYLRLSAERFPNRLEDMMPLYQAVIHGCQAGRYQEAFESVYLNRIYRDATQFSLKQLGAFGTELSALAGFFAEPWIRPARDLDEDARGTCLNAAGFCFIALARVAESADLTNAVFRLHVNAKDWEKAAANAANLAELHLMIGQIVQALHSARESVELADRTEVQFAQLSSMSTLAQMLHKAGNIEEAEAFFNDAERIQKHWQPRYPLLYSAAGAWYCDLLLTTGKHEEVLRRATSTLQWAQSQRILLDIGLDHLSLGRAHLDKGRREASSNFLDAAERLHEAVGTLRGAGRQDHLPLGLLARGELFRVQGESEGAERDIDEAMRIAKRAGMRLYMTDCHLEYARLRLAQKKKDEARDHWQKAKKLVEETGYHGRDAELLLIEAELRLLQGNREAAKETLAAAKKRIDELKCHRWDVEAESLDKRLKPGN